MKIRKFNKKDTKEVASLIVRTYTKFNGKEYYKKEAVKKYINHYDISKNPEEELLKQFNKTPIFYVAIDKKKIVGMIRGKTNKISNLFVDEKYHGKGIGRKLVNMFESDARKRGGKEIKIKASLYATSFYQKMGYKKTTGIRNFIGLKIYPMKKIL